MSTITLKIPDRLMNQLQGRSETIEFLLLKALEDYLQKESFDIPQTKTGEIGGSLEVPNPALMESPEALMLKKEQTVLSLDGLLASIPADFQYPEDVQEFIKSEPVGQEII